MHLIFWTSNKAYEQAVARALSSGAAMHGDGIEVRHVSEYRAPLGDAGICCGVVKEQVIHDHKGRHPLLYIDKGYKREKTVWCGETISAWWRAVWNDTHPTGYLNAVTRPKDRWKSLGLDLKERQSGETILIAGSSEKYHQAHGLLHPTLWTRNLVSLLRIYTDREIVYRPKPSWRKAEPVAGTTFDFGLKTSIQKRVEEAHCVVTHGSMACVEAICSGTPVLSVGHAVARPIGSTRFDEVEHPVWMDRPSREQWAANLAYFQWSPEELTNGLAWTYIKEQFAYAPK